jgi:hypothetical protein
MGKKQGSNESLPLRTGKSETTNGERSGNDLYTGKTGLDSNFH